MVKRELSKPAWPEGQAKTFFTGPFIFGLLVIYVSFRKLIFLEGDWQFFLADFLLAGFSLLYFTKPALTRRFHRFLPLYFLLQMLLIQSLGVLSPYEDTWGLLYILLSIQLLDLPSPRLAAAWASLFTAALLVTMIATHGLLAGLGFTLLIIGVAVFFFSGNLHYSRAEIAKQESQRLLEELRVAHQRLKAYSEQAQELAAAQERDRLIRELHDSVSQMIFSISLTAETTRLLLSKDPGRVPENLTSLQALTAGALAQMRLLISQWRPSQE